MSLLYNPPSRSWFFWTVCHGWIFNKLVWNSEATFAYVSWLWLDQEGKVASIFTEFQLSGNLIRKMFLFAKWLANVKSSKQIRFLMVFKLIWRSNRFESVEEILFYLLVFHLDLMAYELLQTLHFVSIDFHLILIFICIFLKFRVANQVYATLEQLLTILFI